MKINKSKKWEKNLIGVQIDTGNHMIYKIEKNISNLL